MGFPRSRASLARLPLLASLATTLSSSAATAEPDPKAMVPASASVPARSPLAVVVRGGASLGAFEGGTLDYATRFFDRNPDYAELRIVTGTSAGSINGLLTVLASCRASGTTTHAAQPSESPFYGVWMPVGLDGLFDPKRASATAALTRDAAMGRVTKDVERAWSEGFDPSCDVVLGIPVTRTEPRRTKLDAQGTWSASRSTEHFVVRVRGRGKGVVPSVTNYVDPKGAVERAALVTDAEGQVAFTSLLETLYASSGVPLAFASVRIRYCMVGGGRPRKSDGNVVCTKEEAEEAAFVDGGFLENQPLRLATRMASRGLDTDAIPSRLRDVPNVLQRDVPARATFVAIDPAEMTWAPLPASRAKDGSLADVVANFLPGLLDSVQGAELQAVFEETPGIKDDLRVLQSDWPTASAPLSDFFGFFERDFRNFDFYLGMHEARANLRAFAEARANATGKSASWPDPADESPGAVPAGWKPYVCLRAVLDGEGTYSACQGDAMANFRALAQTTVERLYSRCRKVPPVLASGWKGENPSSPRVRCRLANEGAPPPPLAGLPTDDRWAQEPDEAEHDYVVRRLVAHGFAFHDLGVGRANELTVRSRIAEVIGGIATSLAAKQPDDRLLWRSLARVAVQSLEYRPPKHAFHVLAGGSWELGWSTTAPNSPWRPLRFATAVTLDGISSLLNGGATNYLAVIPTVGAEFEPIALSNEKFQLRVGVAGGFQFSTGDAFYTDRVSPTPGVPRSRPAVSAHAALVFYQWVRMQLGASYYPPFGPDGATYVFRPMLGIEIDTPL
ncbi:MAG: patatin-like phospholipase family protein [Polyangiaceae bacterium]